MKAPQRNRRKTKGNRPQRSITISRVGIQHFSQLRIALDPLPRLGRLSRFQSRNLKINASAAAPAALTLEEQLAFILAVCRLVCHDSDSEKTG
jgi:hypothetical protein